MTDIAARIENLEADLQANLVKSMDAMAADPTTATIKAYNAAKKALDIFQADQSHADNGERFKNLEQAAAWIIAQGYIVSARTVRNHAATAGFPRQQKDGAYLLKEISAYAAQAWENPSRPEVKAPQDDDTNEQIKKETLRKLQISNDHKSGSLVPLEDEIRRRVNVIVGMKIAMDNYRPLFIRELVSRLRDSHVGKDAVIEIINQLGEEAGHLYSEIILRVFDAIGKSGGVKAPVLPIPSQEDR